MASHVKAMRLTHTGEDGFVLYIPSEVRGKLTAGGGKGSSKYYEIN